MSSMLGLVGGRKKRLYRLFRGYPQRRIGRCIAAGAPFARGHLLRTIARPEKHRPRMSTDAQHDLDRAIALLPCGQFIMTAGFEDHAAGLLVRWVQRCSTTPPMLMIAIRKGEPIEPIVRDARGFALCQVSSDDRFLIRKFAPDAERQEDPFVCLPTTTGATGAPIIERAMSYLDCELVRNVELDSDHRIYVGQIRGGGVLNPAEPAVHFGDNGQAH